MVRGLQWGEAPLGFAGHTGTRDRAAVNTDPRE